MKRRVSLALVGLVCVCLALSACAKVPVRASYLSAEAPDAEKCRDLTRFPQDLNVYAKLAGEGRVLLPPEEQMRHDAEANAWFFAPWHLKKTAFSQKDALWAYHTLKPEAAFAENLRPFSPVYWEELRANCNAAAYPSRLEYGITVRNTAMRGMPTHRPFLRNPDGAGEGFPFDYFQTTAVWTGTPVLITHVSADGAWVMVETRLAAGWVPAEDVAVMGAEDRKMWEELPLAAILEDNTVLRSLGESDGVTGEPVTALAHIGTILPLSPWREDKDAGALTVYFPVRGATGRAEIRAARLESNQVAAKPLPLTPANIARVGNSMMGRPYGWGGMYENRDCSALTRDILLPFGIWLPRNSASQGGWGTPLELAGLSAGEKEAKIAAKATPFFSLVWLKGHIGLYLGVYEETPVMYHNIWGLRTKDPAFTGKDQDGRAVIGKAVVTSLRPGAELPTIASPNSLLDRIERVSILPRPGPY